MRMNRLKMAAAIGLAISSGLWGQETPPRDPAGNAAKPISLADSVEPFATRFNADQQELRFLAVFSPS